MSIDNIRAVLRNYLNGAPLPAEFEPIRVMFEDAKNEVENPRWCEESLRGGLCNEDCGHCERLNEWSIDDVIEEWETPIWEWAYEKDREARYGVHPVRNINDGFGMNTVSESLSKFYEDIAELHYMPAERLTEGKDYEFVDPEEE